MRTRHVALTAVTVCAPKVIYLNKRHSLILTNQQVMRNFHKFYSMYIYICSYSKVFQVYRLRKRSLLDWSKVCIIFRNVVHITCISTFVLLKVIRIAAFHFKISTSGYIYIYSTKLTFLLRNTTRSVIILNQYCEGENISLCRNV